MAILVSVANINTRFAALVVAGVVAAGGGFAVTEAASGSGPAAPTASAAGTASGPTGQAAVLNGALADASMSSTESAAARPPRIRRAIARLRRLGGVHGEFTFETKQGPRTLAFERGTVTAVTGLDVTVRATDGTTWTWVVTSASVVRQDGTRVTAAALADGKPVFTAGPVAGATRDAALIVIRPVAKKMS
jgi:hypothetical protein